MSELENAVNLKMYDSDKARIELEALKMDAEIGRALKHLVRLLKEQE